MSILLAGACLGLAVNAVSPKRVPWLTPPRVMPRPEDLITLAQARELWELGIGFVLDARAPEDYAAGHIAHALNVPADQFEQHMAAVTPLLAADTPLVVYCDGEDCELSQRLQARLVEMGYAGAKILPDGWAAWRKAGLPTDVDKDP